MRWEKFMVFAVTILAISVVVFNNIADIAQKIFAPTPNFTLLLGFWVITIGVMFYAFINRSMLK